MEKTSNSPATSATTIRIAGRSSAFGVAVSLLSIILLGFLWLQASRARQKLRALTWAVPPGSNVGKRTLFAEAMRKKELDEDDSMVVRVKGSLGKDTVTLHTERSPDLARPVIILSCHDSAWEAIKASKNVETDLLITLLVLSLGNVVAAGVAVICWQLQVSPDLMSSLAGNTLLVIAPLVILSAKLLLSKAREVWASKQLRDGRMVTRFDEIDIETVFFAIKESVEGSVRLLVPVFSMSYILKRKVSPEGLEAGVSIGEPMELGGRIPAPSTGADNGPPHIVRPAPVSNGGMTVPRDDGPDFEDFEVFKKHLQRMEGVQWFRLDGSVYYGGFDTLYEASVMSDLGRFEAAWLGKLLERHNDGERNRIISSVVLSYLRWSIAHAEERSSHMKGNSGQLDNDANDLELGKAEQVRIGLEDAQLLDGEGRPTITFGQADSTAAQSGVTEYLVPFVMLDTISISKAGSTLDKHWAAYKGRKQMQNQEPLLRYLHKLSLRESEGPDGKSRKSELLKVTEDLWAFINRITKDERTKTVREILDLRFKES